MPARDLSTRAVGGLPFVRATALALLATGLAACKDSNVPFLTAPTTVENSPTGIQNAVTGLFAGSRIDVGNYIYYMTGFARDAAQMSIVNPQNVAQQTGLQPIFAGFGANASVWDVEYGNVGGALAILNTLPKTAPAFSTAQLAAGAGAVQTMEALNLMIVAETHDSLGIPIHRADDGGPGPVLCNKGAWASIVALLDTANANLTAAGPTPLPFTLPPGFSSVSAVAGPSTTPGSFAAFNRALAAKAGLELAYAIARNSAGTHPTPTTPGAPDVAALTRADSAAGASAFFDLAALAPPASGGFTDDAHGVYWDFSAQSGDLVNPINGAGGIWQTLKTLVADVDTANDLRWHRKFAHNPFPLQLPQYDSVADTVDAFAYFPGTNTPIPIIRTEGLVLVRAQIQLGLGNLAQALTYLNAVRTSVGGLAPVSGGTYVAVRDLLLREQRISTVFESSGDRTIALRMYHLEAAADTTWHGQDLHTTVVPVALSEIAGRNGDYTLTCP
jgi:hypothetical protein